MRTQMPGTCGPGVHPFRMVKAGKQFPCGAFISTRLFDSQAFQPIAQAAEGDAEHARGRGFVVARLF